MRSAESSRLGGLRSGETRLRKGRETIIQAQCVAVAAAGGTGTIAVVIEYVVP